MAKVLWVTFLLWVLAPYASHGNSHQRQGQSQQLFTVESVCGRTRYPERCMDMLLRHSEGHPQSSSHVYSTEADEQGQGHGHGHDQLHHFLRMALTATTDAAESAHKWVTQHLQEEKTRSTSSNSNAKVVEAALYDCQELLSHTLHHLNASSASASTSHEDITTWLSAAITNQQTCLDGFTDLGVSLAAPAKNSRSRSTRSNATGVGPLSHATTNILEMLSNSLTIHTIFATNSASATVTVSSGSGNNNPNRKLLWQGEGEGDGAPEWLSAADKRHLMAIPVPVPVPSASRGIKADAVVAKDGSGKYTRIMDAVQAAPKKSSRRYVIYIKAGVYKENVEVSKSQTNIMMVGDGQGRTVISGSRSVGGGYTTFRSATVAVAGDGFIARDVGIENTAGAAMHQAVALRVSADRAVLFRCSISGYQDTLYAHSLRQFYRDVDIRGTVDFIFGNAAVVIQRSSIVVRRPLAQQKNTVTAQGRTDPNQNTGICLQRCRITAEPGLARVSAWFPTYLGRPWKEYSRTLVMQSQLDGFLNPAGWLPWNADFALDTLYYAEYANTGAGASTAKRVTWPGFHVLSKASDALAFTVSRFLSGDSWISSAAVPFDSALY